MNVLDTVAAISTPYGKGGIAVIRISGCDSISIADRVFKCASGKKLSQMPNARACYGEIISPDDKKSIDDGIAVCFRAPHSFTGEDTVEISCHGGILITQRVFACVLTAGARAAKAGEFTRRAYVSGRIKLNEAESLGALLEARSESQLSLARGGMKGRLSKRMESLYEDLKKILSGIYAVIDFPDEDLSDMSRDEMQNALLAVYKKVVKLGKTYGTGRAVTEGIPTVICGRTNAGKSSVYNRILGYDAAIVTDIEGTTRDILRETAVMGRVTLLLCDTAGLRDTDDKVESIGIERSIHAIEDAGLVIAVFDGSKEPSEDDIELIGKIQALNKPSVALINKADMTQNAVFDGLCDAFDAKIHVCALTGEGFDALADAVENMFIDGTIDMDNDAVITGARQYASISEAEKYLTLALDDMRAGISLDACCVEVEAAMQSLGEVDGRNISEEIVSDIFSRFCVGK